MELKKKLQDYTRAEFLSLVKKIKRVDGSKEEHDKLLEHFDHVVKHPKGADLLFFPQPDAELFNEDDPEFILYIIKVWHNLKGQTAFKDDALPPPWQKPSGAVSRPGTKEYAWKTSSDNLVNVQKVAAQIHQTKQTAEDAFDKLEALLSAAEATPRVKTLEKASKAHVTLLIDELSTLEAAQKAVISGVFQYNGMKMTVESAKNDAERSISSSQLDRGLQASILQLITQSSSQYLAQRPLIAQRQQALHVRTEAVLKQVEEQLIRVATATASGPMKEATTFRALANDVDATPRVLTTHPDLSDLFDTVMPDLRRAIRSAVGGLTWTSAVAEDEKTVKYASVISFQFSKLGWGEPYAISVPLSEFAPLEGHDWHNLAQMNAEADLGFRMSWGVSGVRPGSFRYSLREINEMTDVYVVPTNEASISSKVKVRTVTWDVESGTYRFIRPGFPISTVLWALSPPFNSKNIAMSDRERTTRPGTINPKSVPKVEAVPTIEDLLFDDCIVVFPADSGIEPVYVMFKGSREYPGAASGTGQVVPGEWLRSEIDDTGAPIPAQIAKQLSGNVFKRFSAFREALWKAVANAPELSVQFSAEDLAAMKDGHAPYASPRSPRTQSERLEIHYVVSPDNGGDVYDMDNMRIMTRRPAGVAGA